MAELFLSYSREDAVKKFVRQLKRDLEDAQLSVWLDEEDMPADTEAPPAVATAIYLNALSSCKALIAVLTKKYVSSSYCKSELYVACRSQKLIFPVVREQDWDVTLSEECSESVKYMKAAYNWVTFLPCDDYRAALQKLVENVNKQGV